MAENSPFVHPFLLYFKDKLLEKKFIEEQYHNFINTVCTYLPITTFLFSVVLLIAIVCSESNRDIFVSMFLCIIPACIFIFIHFRFYPPSVKAARFFYLPLTGITPGIAYSYLFSGDEKVLMFISCHIVFFIILGNMRFIFATLMLSVIVLFNVFVESGLTTLNAGDIFMHTLYFLTVSACCILACYNREYIERMAYFQKQVIMERERQISEERKKSDALLRNILPEVIANRLKNNEKTIADAFDQVTVLFADIVKFTSLSEQISPEELVSILDDIFSMFDHIAEKFGVEKIKTIGDAYMVAAGLPFSRDDHAEAAAEMALEMKEAMAQFRRRTGLPLQIRIGINSGPVVAGVIGRKKFIYDLWGDTVNTASRMESHGIPDEIQVTDCTCQLLHDKYLFQARGPIPVKGKGEMKTYLLQQKLPGS